MAEELVRVEGLVKRFGAVAALDGVTLRIRQGEFIALLGPSGCGKTTLLRAIAGFIEPSAGEIWIDGHRMDRVPPNRRPVNTVFQHYALFPHYTVAENVAFGPRRHGTARQAAAKLVADALAMVGMESLGARYPAQLSGGQQQRVALARAIVNRPKLLLLDEPLGALDLKLRKRMQLELKHLHQKLGIAFLYVTHDQDEALVMADRIGVMDAGRILQLGSGEEIYRRPQSRYVADFIGEANLLACTLDEEGRLCLEAGGIALPYRAEGSRGDAATLLVRPEAITIGAPADGKSAAELEVEVRERVFVGNSTKLYVRTVAGQELVVQPQNQHAVGHLRQGERITVHWPLQEGRVLLR